MGVFAVFYAAFLFPVVVNAEAATVTFGSEEYVSQENGTFQVGVYIQCDAPDFIYNVAIQYDPSRMEYLGGADGGGNGLLQFAGEAAGGQKKYMLSFRALAEGAATISVTQAEVITNPAEGQEEGAMGAEAQQGAVPVVADITQLGLSSIQIQPEIDCRLSELRISEISDFTLEPDVYEYDLTVPYDTGTLDILASSKDSRAEVAISGTELQVGENTVSITVSGGENEIQYLLHVVRQEEAVESTGADENAQEEAAVSVSAVETVNPQEQETVWTESSFSEEGPETDTVDPNEERPVESFREIALIVCVVIILAALILAVWMIQRRKREDGFYDEDEEDDWTDLTTDEKWLHWLEEMEEEEMDEVFSRANLKKKDKTDDELRQEKPLYSPDRVESWIKEKEEGRKDAPGYQRKQESVEQPVAEPVKEQKEPVKDTVIRIEDVSMRFKISEVNAGSLKEYLLATVKRQNRYHELEALQHISFEVEKGEVIGIIGTNGSGKSTLLKLIAGVLKPSEGKIEVDHKKVQLLTLGTGFDSELTARENVYLNGAIIGYSREFIDENYENIVAFAELDGFMDEKIKNFSSGMMSRLGFAIATVGKAAEILILDEVLSVGDMFFRQKSEKRIKEMIHSGSTVLIVSHSTDTIVKNCTRAVWIEKGVLMEIGEPKKVCAAYRKKAG